MEAEGKVIGKISKLSEEPPWNQDPSSEIPSLLPPGWVWLSKFHHTAKAIKSPYTEVLDLSQQSQSILLKCWQLFLRIS